MKDLFVFEMKSVIKLSLTSCRSKEQLRVLVFVTRTKVFWDKMNFSDNLV